MFIRKLASLTAVAMLGLVAFGAMSASASTALRLDPGSVLSGATTIRNTSSDPATLQMPNVGDINCTQTSFDADVDSGFSSSSITGRLTALTFTTCTDSIPVIAISSCSLVPGTFPTIHISSDPNIVTIDDPTLRCSIAGSTTSFCYYTAPVANGQANNALSTLSYSVGGVVVAGGSGSLGAACGSAAGSFNVLLTHIVEGGTNRTVTITTS